MVGYVLKSEIGVEGNDKRRILKGDICYEL